MPNDLSKRLDAVERTVTDGTGDVSSLSDAADVEARIAELERRAADVDDRLVDLEAAMLAVRGYVGGVRAVNRDVERRAEAALAGVESLAEAVGETPSDEAFEAACRQEGDGDDGATAVDTTGTDDGTKTADTADEPLVARLRDAL